MRADLKIKRPAIKIIAGKNRSEAIDLRDAEKLR